MDANKLSELLDGPRRMTYTPPNGEPVLMGWLVNDKDVAFLELARAALGVMTRRGWGVMRSYKPGHWIAVDGCGRAVCEPSHPDPFTALIEADKWFSAVERPGEKGGAK
jgi:hypothetical protein